MGAVVSMYSGINGTSGVGGLWCQWALALVGALVSVGSGFSRTSGVGGLWH